MKVMLVAGALAIFPSPSLASAEFVSQTSHRNCDRLYTVQMGERAARAVYRGTRKVTLQNLRLLGYLERCQANPADQPFVRTFDRHLDHMHKEAIRRAAEPPITHQVSSGGGWTGPWSCIAHYESGGNPGEDTGNGYYGGLQFSMQTWLAYGGSGNPADASIPEQEAVAERILAAQGWSAWPNTSRMCGL